MSSVDENRFRVEAVHHVAVPEDAIMEEEEENQHYFPEDSGSDDSSPKVSRKRIDSKQTSNHSSRRNSSDVPTGKRLGPNKSTFPPHYSQRSLKRYLTREVLPHVDHYRNHLSFSQGKPESHRPTLDELIAERAMSRMASEGHDAEGQPERKSGKVVKFGWIEGVFMRCLLNIWGVMLFLRLTWVVGKAGLIEALLIITLSNIVTTITAISMSAVSTNGQIKAGGIYYMISRSLGPEFGGAIGLTFTLANSIAVAVYTIGFCSSLNDMLHDLIPNFTGIVGVERINDIRLIGSITLVLILGLAIVGLDWVTRVQKLLLFLLLVSQVNFIIGTFLPATDLQRARGFVGYNHDTFMENLYSNYTPFLNTDNKKMEETSFFSVFAVFFPAVTGIVAGANLSGDLHDPGHAIPMGTLSAIVCTYVSYIIYAIMVSGCALREASGIVSEVVSNTTDFEPTYDQCIGRDCEWGISINQQMMVVISAWGPLIYVGCFAATLSSAIASLVGAPRVFQAVAKDKLFPFIGSFAEGWGANNDPVRGYLLTFVISLVCIIMGDLNLVSGLLSNFFVAAYALINFSVFHASITKSPGWRPAFKYYNKWVSLVGTILCVVVMFLMDHYTALATFLCIILLYMYVHVRKPDANWGSSAQAQSFVTALKAVQSLGRVEDHVKNYRPKIIVFSGEPKDRPCLLDFANLITKRLSLLESVNIINEDLNWTQYEAMKLSGDKWLQANNIKAFYTVTRNPNFHEGVRSAIELFGLGKLKPNMMLIGFKENWWTAPQEAENYFKALQVAFDLHLAVGVFRLSGGFDVSYISGVNEKIESAKPARQRTVSESSTNDEERYESKTSVDSGIEFKEDRDDLPKTPVTPKSSSTKSKFSWKKSKDPNVPMVDPDGNPVSEEVIARMVQFRDANKKEGMIDVYWLYDDGGLTLLLPYILQTRAKFQKCKLRIFFLSNKPSELDNETQSMAALLAKFRIEFQDVIIITDATKKPSKESRKEFDEMITIPNRTSKTSCASKDSRSTLDDESVTQLVPESDLIAHFEKTSFYMRIAEIVRQNSRQSADLVVMTLPLPRKGVIPYALYMAWLDFLTRNMPPFLLIRGNQTSVLTFYS